MSYEQISTVRRISDKRFSAQLFQAFGWRARLFHSRAAQRAAENWMKQSQTRLRTPRGTSLKWLVQKSHGTRVRDKQNTKVPQKWSDSAHEGSSQQLIHHRSALRLPSTPSPSLGYSMLSFFGYWNTLTARLLRAATKELWSFFRFFL